MTIWDTIKSFLWAVVATWCCICAAAAIILSFVLPVAWIVTRF